MANPNTSPDPQKSRLNLSSQECHDWIQYGANGISTSLSSEHASAILNSTDPLLKEVQETLRQSMVINDEERDAYVLALRMRKDGDLEFDDSARVSVGDDNGAYVQAYKWVSFIDTPLDQDAEGANSPVEGVTP